MWVLHAADRLTKFLMVFGAIWAFCLCFIVLGDIFLRLIGNPVTGTKEIIANSVVIIVFMQVGFAVRGGTMLRADFLTVMFPGWVQKMLLILACGLGAIFFLFLLYAAVPHAIRSFSRGEMDGVGAFQVRVWPARWVIVFGSGLAGLNDILVAIIEIFDLRVDTLKV